MINDSGNSKKMTDPKSNDFEINRLIEQARCWEPEAETLFDLIEYPSGLEMH